MIKYLSEQELENIADATMLREFVCLTTDEMQALLSEVREARLYAALVSRDTMDMQALLDEARHAQSVNPNSARLIAGPREAPEPHWEVKWGNGPTRSATPEGTSVGWEPFAVDDGKIYMRRQV